MGRSTERGLWRPYLAVARNKVQQFVAYVGRWIPSHPRITAALVVNVIFVFLPFYDPNNIPLELSFASHLNSNIPAFSFSSWVAGPYIDALFVPSYLFYLVSGYSLYWAYTAIKLVSLVLTCTLAYALWSSFPATSRAFGASVVLFTLGNPVWFVVNYIWVEYDIFPVAFLALGYVILRSGKRPANDVARLAIAAGCITTSIFFYWFALAAVPALLIYSRNNRERLTLLVILVVFSAILLYVMAFLLSGGIGPFITTLLGGSSSVNRAKYFGFQYFFKLSPFQYALVALGAAVIVPLFFRLIGIREPAAIFVTLILTVFTSAIPMPDNYVVIFPFAVLALVRPEISKINWGLLWGSIAYPIAGLFLINVIITNAQPDGAGLFFFGYSIFRRNILFITTQTALHEFYRVFNYTVVSAIVLSTGIVTLENFLHREKRTGVSEIRASDLHHRQVLSSVASIRRVRRKTWMTWALALSLLSIAALAFNAALPNAVQYAGVGTAPTYEVMPTFIPGNGNVVRPIPGETYTQDGAVYSVSSSCPPFEFGRWFSGQAVELSASEAFSGSIPSSVMILNGTPFSVALLNVTQPIIPSSVELSPNSTVNVTSLGDSPIPLLGLTRALYGFNGQSTATYDFTSAQIQGQYFGFAFNLSRLAPDGTNLIHLQGPEGFAALVLYPSTAVLVYAGPSTNGSFVNVRFSTTTAPGGWSYLVFHATQYSFSVDLDGKNETANASLFPTGPVQLRIGEPFDSVGPNGSLPGYNYSLVGRATGLFSGTAPWQIQSSYDAEISSVAGSDYVQLNSSVLNISVQGTAFTSAITIDSNRYTTPFPTTQIWMGKFTSGSYLITIVLSEFRITQVAPDRFELLPVFATMVTPYIVLVLGIRRIRLSSR